MTLQGRLRDERGIIGSSLVRYALVLIVLGVVMIEAGSIVFTLISLQNAADTAAVVAADEWQKTGNLRSARRVAREQLDTSDQDDASITHIEADGAPNYELRLTVQKEASTILVSRIGFLKDLGIVDVEADARPVESGA